MGPLFAKHFFKRRERRNQASCGRGGVTSDKLETLVADKGFCAFDFSEVAVAVSDAHERLFAEAEAGG